MYIPYKQGKPSIWKYVSVEIFAARQEHEMDGRYKNKRMLLSRFVMPCLARTCDCERRVYIPSHPILSISLSLFYFFYLVE